jgi:hypothetical protein
MILFRRQAIRQQETPRGAPQRGKMYRRAASGLSIGLP